MSSKMLFFFNQPSDKYPTIHTSEILSEKSFEILFSITTKKRPQLEETIINNNNNTNR